MGEKKENRTGGEKDKEKRKILPGTGTRSFIEVKTSTLSGPNSQ